jgi:hypothetical protein
MEFLIHSLDGYVDFFGSVFSIDLSRTKLHSLHNSLNNVNRPDHVILYHFIDHLCSQYIFIRYNIFHLNNIVYIVNNGRGQ